VSIRPESPLLLNRIRPEGRPLKCLLRHRALLAAAAHALSQGVTTVGDMGRALGPKGHETVWSDFEEVSLPDMPQRQ
jgi:hypothetical protein